MGPWEPFQGGGAPLESDFVAVLSAAAGGERSLDSIADWFDANEGAFRGEAASPELRLLIQEALAVRWRVRRRRLTETAARAELRHLADLLADVRSAECRAHLAATGDSGSRWVGRRRHPGP